MASASASASATATTALLKPTSPLRLKIPALAAAPLPPPPWRRRQQPLRRDILFQTATAAVLLMQPASGAKAAGEDEYVKETSEVIKKVRGTLTKDKNDPNVAAAVTELREASNAWVAKYRKEKALLGKASFRDMYSALNAVSGHYISFGPTTPIPAKRKARILEEMDTAEKALLRGR